MTSILPGLKRTTRPSQRLLWRTIAVLCLAAPIGAQTRGFIPIDAPGAGTLQNQGTIASVINQSGVVAGYYNDNKYAYHGFVRSAQGVITEFDAPGLTNTQVFGINSSGQIAGDGHHQSSTHGETLGFLRDPNGTFTGLRAPNALVTFPVGIDDSGEIAGTYYTAGYVNHSFVSTLSGGTFIFTLFDEPNASHNSGFGTYATGINANGVVVGNYEDATVGAYHGFTRDRSGNFASFDAPGAGTGQAYGTIPLAINLSGEIAGYYSDSNAILHAFIRDASGNITDFDPPGSTQTFANGINDQGDVVGYWVDSHQVYRGFLREASGRITSFSVPVKNNGTFIISINNARQMTGFYYDTIAAMHGFLWQVSVGSSQ
jgi:hypothetical protein